ncbi:MAG: thioredoxin family protein [Alphaproteobacteria bacterium]|jgi:thiol:disulfide interchange protein/DsbC/DsbD-like thiol-disulfide interchange protein|nr:thioredoxin family protein [Alphaproteobacteria bacterium]
MRRLLKACLVSIFLALSIGPVHAQDGEGPFVQLRLVPEGVLKPGNEITIAIEQSIAPGWHTYWKNPGDSGAAPRIKWTMPDGFTAGTIEWPVPHKLPYGPLLNYGYEDAVILLQKIQTPAELPEGPVTLTADIDVLVCKEICIPESGKYEITLNGPDSSNADNASYFENARGKLPLPNPSRASYFEQNGAFVIDMPVSWSQGVKRYDYIPAEWGMVENTAPSEINIEGGRLTIKQQRGQRALSEVQEVPGLLLWSMDESGPMNAYEFTAVVSDNPPAATPVPAPNAAPDKSLIIVLFFALLGGIILNLMPCVFPVLSIKALGLVKIAEKEPAKARLHGIAYTAGVILSFLGIAGLLIALKSGGAQIGWGFQLQSPEIVTALAWLFFIIGLNLSGIFEIGGHLGNVGNKLTQGNTPGHSFFTGVLATLVATPCTAPFMGVALGFALTQSAFISLLVFAVLGLGLALPYLALSFIPALQKILPKPGTWMHTFKQFLAFPMYASAAWLVWVLSQQSGQMGVFAALMGLVLIAFGIWLLRHEPAKLLWKNIVRVFAILAFLAALMLIPGGTQKPEESTGFSQEWSPQKLSQLLEGGDAIFVEMTAAWCITCKVNHAIAIDVPSTRRVFSERGVQYLVGDWTNQNPEITQYLNGFGRNGVPIYVYYGPRSNGVRPEPVLLPQILTPGIVAKAVTGN